MFQSSFSITKTFFSFHPKVIISIRTVKARTIDFHFKCDNVWLLSLTHTCTSWYMLFIILNSFTYYAYFLLIPVVILLVENLSMIHTASSFEIIVSLLPHKRWKYDLLLSVKGFISGWERERVSGTASFIFPSLAICLPHPTKLIPRLAAVWSDIH